VRLALGIEYNGSDYLGWQRQEDKLTVQLTLEQALSRIAASPVSVICAGRTDAGVHALGQVVHFDTDKERPMHAWLIGANTYLPKNISIKWVKIVDENFHARFSAKSRAYRYIIHNIAIPSALMAGRVTWHRYNLDAEQMDLAAQYLLGEHDFSSFRSSRCESKSAMRSVKSISVKRLNDFVVIDIKANAFLHHMVRNITGVLLRIGSGREKVTWARDVLLARDRKIAAETAAPHGLYLYQVTYPEIYDFPLPVINSNFCL